MSWSVPVADLASVNTSAARWNPSDTVAAASLSERHMIARDTCAAARRQTLRNGGWCLRKMARDELFGKERSVQLRSAPGEPASSYRLPGSHVEADAIIVAELAALIGLPTASNRPLMPTSSEPRSVIDFGAGVGQYYYGLREIARPKSASLLRWRGYDGAGDVEEYTNGRVSFVDLTLPSLALERADWVVSLEVGEHIPREHEYTFLRNLHAHNCMGVVLSWACYGGHQHVNRRPNDWVIDAFQRLGYRYDAATSQRMRQPGLRDRLSSNYSYRVYGWFARSVMVFERWTPVC